MELPFLPDRETGPLSLGRRSTVVNSLRLNSPNSATPMSAVA
jgi:hypothetical protein